MAEMTEKTTRILLVEDDQNLGSLLCEFLNAKGFDADLATDGKKGYAKYGNGTYDLTPANGPVGITGGPEGILYVPPGSALIPDYQYVLIAEYGSGEVSLYLLDGDGNPLPATRTPFLTGLSGAEGACTR